jgi:hypothetical protein
LWSEAELGPDVRLGEQHSGTEHFKTGCSYPPRRRCRSGDIITTMVEEEIDYTYATEHY